jgi:hypothetical protein
MGTSLHRGPIGEPGGGGSIYQDLGEIVEGGV